MFVGEKNKKNKKKLGKLKKNGPGWCKVCLIFYNMLDMIGRSHSIAQF